MRAQLSSDITKNADPHDPFIFTEEESDATDAVAMAISDSAIEQHGNFESSPKKPHDYMVSVDDGRGLPTNRVETPHIYKKPAFFSNRLTFNCLRTSSVSPTPNPREIPAKNRYAALQNDSYLSPQPKGRSFPSLQFYQKKDKIEKKSLGMPTRLPSASRGPTYPQLGTKSPSLLGDNYKYGTTTRHVHPISPLAERSDNKENSTVITKSPKRSLIYNELSPIKNESSKKFCTSPILFDSEDDVEVAQESKTVAREKLGLKNFGNTCYMNSAIQCLLGLEEFCEDVKNASPEQSFLLPPLQKLIKAAEQGDLQIAWGAIEHLRVIFCSVADRNFRGFKQQDAGEFISKLLNKIEEDIEKTHKFYSSEPPPPSFINENFGFELLERHTCKSCEKVREDKQKHQLLYLPLPEEKKDDLLHSLTPPSPPSIQNLLELVLGTHPSKCAHCGEEEGACQTRISKLPRVLAVQLKRYTNELEKIHAPVRLSPYLNLDAFVTENCVQPKPLSRRFITSTQENEKENASSMTPVLTMPEEDPAFKLAMEASRLEQVMVEKESESLKEVMQKSLIETYDTENWDSNDLDSVFYIPPSVKNYYRLVGVICHKGYDAVSGHYTANVYRDFNKQWYKYNDRYVDELNGQALFGSYCQQNCYILFYVHKDQLRQN